MEELQTFVEDQNFKQSLIIEPDDQNDSYCDKIQKKLEKSASFKIIPIHTPVSYSHRRTLSDHHQ